MGSIDNKPKNSDEIDLGQFFRWIGQGFTRVGNGFLWSVASLRNLFITNRLFFIGIILLGMVMGAVYSELLKKKFYKSSMVLSCDYLNTQILQNTIEKLNLLSLEKEREGLAEVLKIDKNTALNIQKFYFKSFVSEDDVVEMEVLRTQLNNVVADKKDIVEKVMTKLEIENKNAYEISVEVYNSEVVKPLEKALVDFFKSSDYVKRRIEISKENLVQRKAKLEHESKRLDSLKTALLLNYKMFAKNNRGSNNVVVGENGNNPLDIFKEDLQINREILDIDKKLYLQPDFEVVEGFTTFKEPESASLPKILVISFLVSFLAGYLIIGAWRFDKLLANYPTQPKVAANN